MSTQRRLLDFPRPSRAHPSPTTRTTLIYRRKTSTSFFFMLQCPGLSSSQMPISRELVLGSFNVVFSVAWQEFPEAEMEMLKRCVQV